MKIVRSDAHLAHAPAGEVYGGELVEPFERADRHRFIEAALADAGFDDAVEPGEVERDLIERSRPPSSGRGRHFCDS